MSTASAGAGERTAPEASVIVPTRGGAGRLPRLLGALAAQQDAPAFEVCVVVDGDVDGTQAVLDRCAARWPRLALHRVVFPENRGRSAALNAGADATTGRILIRADDDLEPGPHYLRDHVAAHEGGDRGVIGLQRHVLPSTAYQRVYGTEADRRHAREAYALPSEGAWRHWAGNVSVPRHLHERIGGYSDAFRRYGWEDVDYGYRLHELGVPVRLHRGLEVAHRAAATTTLSKARRALHSGASRRIFIDRHGAAALGGDRAPGGLWGALVRLTAAGTTERTLRATAPAIDRIVERLPRPVGVKLIALQVEAAAEAGRHRPDRAAATF
ncbi:glycosyltransferase family 2 protein [Kocuria palustris]|uniref:glycosyltransferase family 2 protein n=1 Tax=Kocuria palustris TaxID=71999 RepID=UPI00164237A0|nr:glycosyltransferase family 2 protein [Kocuria palustris]